MAENATLFIPDISGYTGFLSRTELEHSSHIISELLELVADSNFTDLTLSEVEGDALMFFRKGQAISKADMAAQCLTMFRNFHTRLRLIERDTMCQCGACQTATNLTLKFIIHYGNVREIKVANFSKLSGIELVVAHRLLKNSIDSDEYILATQSYWDAVHDELSDPELAWQPAYEQYPAVGKVSFRYALLGKIKSEIPAPPPRTQSSFAVGDNAIAIDVAAPLAKAYKLLTDLNNQVDWIPGLKRIDGDSPVNRLGSAHRCVFDEMTVEIMAERSEIRGDEIHYVEACREPHLGLKYFLDFQLTKKNDNLTRVMTKIGAEPGHPLAPEVAAMVWQTMREVVEAFKRFCEAYPDDTST